MEINDFKVFKLDNIKDYVPSFGRKDLYRICLVKGNSRFHYNDQNIGISGNYMFFGNINTPYSWQIESEELGGYSCLFTQDLLEGVKHGQKLEYFSPFHSANIPLYAVTDDEQVANISFIFERMLALAASDYPNRRDMIKSFINLLMHEALAIKSQSVDKQIIDTDVKSTQKLSAQFLNLLNSQFPVENKLFSLEMKTAADFADKLHVHPNYLNRAVKSDIGRTVLKLINERIITEAKVLLEYTDWTISEIAFCLGFEYHSYFDNVFKKVVGLNPKAYRERISSK